MQGVVGAVEKKGGAAGDGTILADVKMVVVDGVVIADVVGFKIARIVNEVVVDGKVADMNVGIGDGVFQVDGLEIAAAGIKRMWIHVASFLMIGGSDAAGCHRNDCFEHNKQCSHEQRRRSSRVWPKDLLDLRCGGGRKHR